jgi:hypothetical protein
MTAPIRSTNYSLATKNIPPVATAAQLCSFSIPDHPVSESLVPFNTHRIVAVRADVPAA